MGPTGNGTKQPHQKYFMSNVAFSLRPTLAVNGQRWPQSKLQGWKMQEWKKQE